MQKPEYSFYADWCFLFYISTSKYWDNRFNSSLWYKKEIYIQSINIFIENGRESQITKRLSSMINFLATVKYFEGLQKKEYRIKFEEILLQTANSFQVVLKSTIISILLFSLRDRWRQENVYHCKLTLNLSNPEV